MYFVTSGTYQKEHYFGSRKRLRFLHHTLLDLAQKFDWQLEAWAVFSNHYHFVASSPKEAGSAESLSLFLAQLHEFTARFVNRLDSEKGRKVWHNFRETRLTHQTSYFARLNYVHQNAVRHRLVPFANQYPWCSAGWFERTGSPAMVKSIYRFKTDNVNVDDDYNVFGSSGV